MTAEVVMIIQNQDAGVGHPVAIGPGGRQAGEARPYNDQVIALFGLQGVGKLTYDALQNLDLPVIMTTVIYASFFVVLANALVDIVYILLDPRVRSA